MNSTPALKKTKKKLGHTAQKKTLKYIKEKILPSENPRLLGKSLSGKLSDIWWYRVGDYRLLAKIEDDQFVILIIHVGHKKDVYR